MRSCPVLPNKMEDTSLAVIKKYYGSRVETYCKDENILTCRIKCGGLKLTNLSDLMVCSHIKKTERVQKEWSKMKKLNSNARKLTVQKNILVKENKATPISLKKKKKATSISLKKKKEASCDDYLTRVDVKFIMHNTSAKISAKHPTKRCILDKAISGTQIYKHIMKTKVRPFELEIDTEIGSIWELISILELFQEKHMVHNYKGFLKNIVPKKSLNKCGKVSRREIQKPWQNLDNYEITAQQLSTFVAQILIAVVPIELFGCFKNREIFTRLVCCILRSRHFQPIYLIPYIKKFNIEKMIWLQPFVDESVQWLVTIKLVKWLLLEYIMKILYKYIHVTIHPSAVGQRLYFRRYLWDRIKENFIQENIKSKTLTPIIDKTMTDCYPETYEYKLLMKHSGLRPIVKVKNIKEEIPEMKLLLRFLRQLCATHYGLTSMAEFCDKWKAVVATRNISTDNKTLLVSCDLDNAYGSILLDQLNRIIRNLCEDLPEQLTLTWIACLPYKCKDSEIVYSKHFNDLQLAIPTGTLYTSDVVLNNYCRCYIEKKVLLKFLTTFIFHQNIRVKGKDYLVNKGILQGTMLSNILFDIYYSYISHQRLSTFLNTGILFRYVDDILYLTESMESAIQFIEKINRGFTTYNCKFKLSKIQTNFSYKNNYCKNEITYLGWKINCNTLEILPYYSEAHPSYLYSMAIKNKKRNNFITLSKIILRNHSHLRLSHILLKDSENLMSFIKEIATMNAWRAFTFIRKFPKDVHKHAKEIFQIIKKSNLNIFKALLNLHTKDIQKNLKYRREMKIKIFRSLWTICRRVFFTDITVRDAFEDLLIEERMEHAVEAIQNDLQLYKS